MVRGQVGPIRRQINEPQPSSHVLDSTGFLSTGEHPVDETPDFSDAEPQPDGSLCVIKVKHVQKLEKQQIKECWHQNVSSCHNTFVTEFKAMQERKCDDNTFWKTCKISFKEISLNYTVKTCFKPLVKKCPRRYVPQTTAISFQDLRSVTTRQSRQPW